MHGRIDSALWASDRARQGAVFDADAWVAEPTKRVAIGDPQTTARQFFSVLAHQGLLRDDGLLVDDVTLVSMGDHFDFGRAGDAEAGRTVGREGMCILAWLAAHPPSRVRILLGNHDAVRVMELIGLEDEDFTAARTLALEHAQAERSGDPGAMARLAEAFRERFPTIPTSEAARRDFSAYATEQRALVADLLLNRRMQLATTARHPDGRAVLLTHAGVTRRELGHLGADGNAEAEELATRLNAWLARAVERVAEDWRRQRWTPLDLAPLSVTGAAGREGGGMLFHRPASPEAPSLQNRGEEFDSTSPRRFHPGELPAGLIQAVGHSRHQKLLKELQPWLAEGVADASPARLRTLTVSEEGVRYEVGTAAPIVGQAAMHMLDVDMNHQDPAECEVLRRM